MLPHKIYLLVRISVASTVVAFPAVVDGVVPVIVAVPGFYTFRALLGVHNLADVPDDRYNALEKWGWYADILCALPLS